MEVKSKQRLILYSVVSITSLCLLIALKDFGRGDLSLTTFLAIAGGFASTLRYCNKEKAFSFKKLFSTLKDDYSFKTNLTPELSYLVYAISQGSLLGAALGFFVDWMHAFITQQSINPESYLLLSIASLSLIIFTRLTLEMYILIYKLALELKEPTKKGR